jgi:hypothetical protein
MSHSPRTQTDADRTWPTPSRWPRELVQRHADDVVLAAAICKPNAPGTHELGGFAALGQRQLLKARGAYLAERVALGVTPLNVHALALFLGRRVARVVGCWSREDLRATLVSPIGDTTDPIWPALLLTDAYGRRHAELQLLERTDDGWNLLALLTHHRAPRIH